MAKEFVEREALVKDMRDYADRKAACGHIELANGILKGVGRAEDFPAADVVEVVKLEELTLAMAEMNTKFAEEKLALLKIIKELSEADPVKHGRWSCDSEDGWDNFDWHCTECGGSIGYRCGNPIFSQYCPNCGAKMDGGADS